MESQTSLIGAIDQGTSSSRFLLFNSKKEVVSFHQIEIESYHPFEGWCEQDPEELYSKTIECIELTLGQSKKHGFDPSQIKAVGITNQRETTIVWDKNTGKPLCRAVVWLDARTGSTVEKLISSTPTKSKDYLQQKCGLPLATYFSAVKLKWLMDNNEAVQKAVSEERCLFGTVDTWLVWNLTGGTNGGKHYTDVTNASRTMLMNLATQQWDAELCEFFGIPQHILPEIRSSSEIYGTITHAVLNGVPIAGILGDQQAALVGQNCFRSGDAKNTYGTGNFLLYNTGKDVVYSKNGLLTTVAYKFGPESPTHFALEGSIAITGAAIKWLRDGLEVIKSASETSEIAASVPDNGGVYFVPAFSGLFAPYWQPNARGIIIGLTQFITKAHIVRAAMEAVCFQTKEILDAMNQDSGIPLQLLLVDGGMTVNDMLMQMQADLLGIDVLRPKMAETTALGAAIAAGAAKGIELWDPCSNTDCNQESMTQFSSKLDPSKRDEMYGKWKKAVQRCIGWTD
eukprot:gene19091-21007_t